MAAYILETLGYPAHDVELAKIAGYLHDIGNLINRIAHSQSGAIMAFKLLTDRGMDPADVATVATAIGNHDEGTGVPVNPISAALILATSPTCAAAAFARGQVHVRHPRPRQLLRQEIRPQDQRGPHHHQAEADGRHALRLGHGLL